MKIDFSTNEFASAAIAGVLGTVAFGAFFAAIGNMGTIKGAIPALYGLGPSAAIGWAIHLFHGAVLGVVYAAIISNTSYGHHLEDVKKATGWGVLYGAATTLLLAAVLMPLWLSTVGAPMQPPLPNFSPMGLVGHLIYGAVLGASYPVIRGQLE